MKVRLFNMAKQEIFKEDQDKLGEFTTLKNLLKRNCNQIEGLSRGEIISAGIPVSFHDFDAMTQGLRRGDLIAFAGRPSMGKTSLALQFAINIASQNLPVCFFGFDMSKEQTAFRILAMESGIELGRIRTGRLTFEEWQLVDEKNTKLESLPIFLEDKRCITIDEIKTRCKKISMTNDDKNLGLIVIDSFHMKEQKKLLLIWN